MELAEPFTGDSLRVQDRRMRSHSDRFRRSKTPASCAGLKKAGPSKLRWTHHRAAMRAMEGEMTKREIAARLNYEQGKKWCERGLRLIANRGSGSKDTYALFDGTRADSNAAILVGSIACGSTSMMPTTFTPDAAGRRHILPNGSVRLTISCWRAENRCGAFQSGKFDHGQRARMP